MMKLLKYRMKLQDRQTYLRYVTYIALYADCMRHSCPDLRRSARMSFGDLSTFGSCLAEQRGLTHVSVALSAQRIVDRLPKLR
jgi:hypothetical protein